MAMVSKTKLLLARWTHPKGECSHAISNHHTPRHVVCHRRRALPGLGGGAITGENDAPIAP